MTNRYIFWAEKIILVLVPLIKVAAGKRLAKENDLTQRKAAPEKTVGSVSAGERIKAASDIFKSIGVFFAFSWLVISFVAVIFWEARGEPWLANRIKAQLELPEHEDWMRRQVLLALSDNREALVQEIEADHNGRPIVDTLRKKPTVEDLQLLFENQRFRDLFLREVLLAVSNRDEKRVNEILATYKDENLLDAWLNPPSVLALAGQVTEQVDALYTYELFHTREARWENGKPVQDSSGNQVFETRSQISNRFYANSDQRLTIEVDPNLTGRFREAFDQGASQLFLEIGSTYREPIPRNGLIAEITCVVKDQLRGKPSGFVALRAITDSGEIPEGGYELDVIITARKGGKTCI